MKLPVNIYDLAYGTAFVPAAAMVLYKQRRYGKYTESGPALIGRQLREDRGNPLFQNGTVWIHAVSVGEVIAAKAMLPLLRDRFGSLPILITTHTETGQSVAHTLPEHLVDAVRYMPLDFSWLMRQAVATWRPRIFLPMEAEFWPNAFSIISGSGAKVFTLNGKISERSFGSYQRILPLIRQPLSHVTAFCMQTAGDAERIAALTGRSDNVHVSGNCKFDVEIPVLDDLEKQALAQSLGIDWPGQYIVVGSTHPGEEILALEAFESIRRIHPSVKMIIVPRHPERFAEVWQQLQGSGHTVRRSSDQEQSGDGIPNVYLVDQMGVLTRLYSLARIAVVAGSFVDGIGGHNLLEPAAHGVPVVYGPYMKSQPDMLRIMTQSGAGTQASPQDLANALIRLLDNAGDAADKGYKGRTAYQANRGSAARNMAVIEQYLES